jgi:hypothetical protein
MDRAMKARPERRDRRPRRERLPRRLVGLLGVLRDLEVAQLAGVTQRTVEAERTRRGIASAPARRSPVPWTAAMIARLGTATDKEVAVELKLPPAWVFQKRRSLDIPPFRQPPERHPELWTPPRVALLGTAPDGEVARRLGVTTAAVRNRRRLLGIPPLPAAQRSPRRPAFWTRERVALLGKAPDGEVARQLGVTAGMVGYRRHLLGIPAFPAARQSSFWTPGRVALLGTATDREVARRLGVTAATVCNRRHALEIRAFPAGQPAPAPPSFWTPERDALLGTATDREIARRLGVTAVTVWYRRHALGIAAAGRGRERRRWTRARVRLLGQVSDAEVGRRCGLATQTVRKVRLRHGIAAYRGRGFRIARTAELARLLRRPTKEVCRVAGIGKSTVGQLRKELGVPAPARPSAWTPRALARLGKVADAELARELGLRVETVAGKRRQRGLRQRWPWTPEELRQVGTEDDRAVARRLGRSVTAVKRRRQHLGRPAVPPSRPASRPAPRPPVWTPEALARLGQVPDAELARELGVKRRPPGRRGTPEERLEPGTGSDREVQPRQGRSVSRTRRRLL